MKVVFTWIEGKATREVTQSVVSDNLERSHCCKDASFVNHAEKLIYPLEQSKVGHIKYTESNDCQADRHPIDEILYWHNATVLKLLHDSYPRYDP